MANAVSDAVRGWHWDDQKYWQIMDNEMQGSYSALAVE